MRVISNKSACLNHRSQLSLPSICSFNVSSMPPVQQSASKWELFLVLDLEEGNAAHDNLYKSMKVCGQPPLFNVIFSTNKSDCLAGRSKGHVRCSTQRQTHNVEATICHCARALVFLSILRLSNPASHRENLFQSQQSDSTVLRKGANGRGQLGSQVVSLPRLPVP